MSNIIYVEDLSFIVVDGIWVAKQPVMQKILVETAGASTDLENATWFLLELGMSMRLGLVVITSACSGWTVKLWARRQWKKNSADILLHV